MSNNIKKKRTVSKVDRAEIELSNHNSSRELTSRDFFNLESPMTSVATMGRAVILDDADVAAVLLLDGDEDDRAKDLVDTTA
jgi:hypothetical protein